MLGRSHIDESKLDRVPAGQVFEYKDVVSDEFPDEERTMDGKRFKEEVERGIHESISIEKQTGSHLLYKKL